MGKCSIQATINILNRLKNEDEELKRDADDRFELTSLSNYIRNEIPRIRVLKLPQTHRLREHGEYVSLDNRRLFCFRSIGLPELKVPVLVLSYEKMEAAKLSGGRHELWKLTTRSGGIPIVRGNS